MNSKISYLYDPFDPAVLRLIGFVLDQAAKHGIPAGMCGELAGDPLATKLLLGMGLRDFSMSAATIPAIKKIIISASSEEAKRVYETVKQMDNSETIKAYLKGL
jgi:phosphotransferase system enzyme I (PtsI)